MITPAVVLWGFATTRINSGEDNGVRRTIS